MGQSIFTPMETAVLDALLSSPAVQTRKSEQIANELDCDLYRLLGRVEGMIESDQLRKKLWEELASRLRQARGVARNLMSERDLKATA